MALKSRRPSAPKLSLMARLKQHHMFRVASWYATLSYVLILVANAVFPDIGLTREDVRYVIAGLALGFPVVLSLGWVFIPPSQENPKDFTRWRRARWRLGAIVSVAVTAFVIASGIYLWSVNERHMNAAGNPLPAKSVAVLPFEDLSGDPNNAYFSAGIQDEILTRLAKISDLKVVSRTSTLQYASHPENLRKVGAELGVAAVLEGSVQRSGDTVRVNVQLIDTASDTHLWAETYDQDLKDIFSAESSIAGKVADALQATLLPAESARIAAVPTKDPAAYDLYLRAEYLFLPMDSGDTPDEQLDAAVAEMVSLYSKAIEHDPKFLLAYAHRARARIYAYWNRNGVDGSLLSAAQRDAEKALALDPASPDAHLAMGYVYYFGHSDYAKALSEFDKVQRDFPNDADVIKAIALVHRRLGDADIIPDIRRAEALDPAKTELYLRFEVTTDMVSGHYTDARAAIERDHALDPDDPGYYPYRANTFIAQGRLQEAKAILDKYPADHRDDSDYIFSAFALAHLERDPEAMLKALSLQRGEVADATTPISIYRGVAYRMAHRDAEAKAAFASAAVILDAELKKTPRNPELWDTMAYVQALQGKKVEALESAEHAVALLPISKDALNGPRYLYNLAVVQAINGDVPSAVDTLDKVMAGLHGADVSVALLKLDPDWDAARQDPGFKELLDKYAPTEQL